MIIELKPWEYEHAYNVGIKRYIANWNKADAKHYENENNKEEERNASPGSAICELAVAKYTNQYWHASVWHESEHHKYKNMPDVGKNVEVRRVRTQSGPTVRDYELNKNLIIWGAAIILDDIKTKKTEYRKVKLLGWISADEGWEKGIQTDWGRTIPLELLNKDWIEEE